MCGAGKKRSELAVSPVIGVMLMLVITVLLAAAVSSFTGGLKAQKPAPTANFEVKIVKLENVNPNTYKPNPNSSMNLVAYMQITEISGDRIPTKDLEIITYNPDAYGSHKTMVVKPTGRNTHYYLLWYNRTTKTINKTWISGNSPYYNNVGAGWFGWSPTVNFGNYTVVPGITMTADWYDNYCQGKWNSSSGWYNLNGDIYANNVTGFCACIADGWNVTPGHYITVKIVYTPTHTVIWEKKVLVEGEGI